MPLVKGHAIIKMAFSLVYPFKGRLIFSTYFIFSL